jgi:hypothetical protein
VELLLQQGPRQKVSQVSGDAHAAPVQLKQIDMLNRP